MQLIAHRGLITEDIKENTMDAFINAIKYNYDGIELDIRKTQDNKIVVLHDSLINRTSNGKGNIKKYTYKELLKYNFGSKKIKSNIPLLLDVIKKINNKVIIIELKEKFNREELENILKINETNIYYITSFNKKYVDVFINSKYKKGLINYVFNSLIDIKVYDFMLILEDLFNEDIYNHMKNNNIEPILYGVINNINLKNKNILKNLKYII